jgi:hypothetical protein
VESSRKQRKGETKKCLEEIHSERSGRSWSELRYLVADHDKQEKLVYNLCS